MELRLQLEALLRLQLEALLRLQLPTAKYIGKGEKSRRSSGPRPQFQIPHQHNY